MKPYLALLSMICLVALAGCSKPPAEKPVEPSSEGPAAVEPAPPAESPSPAQDPTEDPTEEPAEPQPSPGVDPAAAAGQPGEMPPDWKPPSTEKPAITSEAELRASLLAANPGFGGELVAAFDPQSGMIQIALQDPAVTDITPLGKAGPLLKSLVSGGGGALPSDTPPVAVSLGGTGVSDISALAEIDGIVALDLAKTNVSDLGPIKGAPIRELYLEETKVEDIGPLEGMPLEKLYLSHTKVSDLGPLKGSPLKELNIVGSKVSDLSPLEGSWVQMLWLSECPVEDLTPLKKIPLVSVTMEDTPVSDLSPLERHPSLRRLHIAKTEVTDLTPIKWLKLTRLIFSPERIEKGIGFARDMETLTEIGPSFDERMPPAQFWRAYEAGAFRKK